jgi:two-component system response regulator HydG
LRVLEERKITRLGANDELSLNVRLVAATNANLRKMVDDGKFREDLYYRINVVSIFLPPLRERTGDIPLLMEHFLRDLSKRFNREVTGFSRAARKALLAYSWPGNIRQLRNTIERMLVLDSDGVLDIDGLPPEIAVLIKDQLPESELNEPSGADSLIGKPMTDVEKYYIERALELTDGNREEAARLLEIGERTLYRKIKEYDLRR